MRLSEIIKELAEEIFQNGDQELGDDFLIQYDYGELQILTPTNKEE